MHVALRTSTQLNLQIIFRPFVVHYSFQNTMGRNKRIRHKRGKPSDDTRSAEDGGQQNSNRGNYRLTEKKNELFEMYYKNQPFMEDEDMDKFQETLRAPLPATFRITGSNTHARELLRVVKGEFFSKVTEGTVEGKKIEPPQCLSWYPDGMAWQLDLDRKVIRHHAALKKLHEFLVSETDGGYISRQEGVSMIPPLLLDIKPHHTVLDMCAAPGSKTAQLIELLHADQEATGKLPSGLVIANDNDNKRCYLMMHQVKRLASPNFLITNHDASQLPNYRIDKEDHRKILKFDRILADVPCSGDGTMRKNPDVWEKWHTAMAHNLHSIQRRILERGVQMLEVGGRLVYSTCSMNPVEDEAVLSNVLLKCEGAMELVDVSEELPGLKYTPGISKWTLLSRDKTWCSTVEEVPEKYKTQMHPSMFPPTEEQAKTLNLHHCLRILPHHQNTGGFFVAVLRKLREVPWIKEKDRSGAADAEGSAEGEAGDGEEGKKRKIYHDDGRAPPRKKQFHGYKEDPFVFLKADDPVLPGIKSFFDLSESFPCEQLLVRSHEGKKRNIYFASKEIKNILECNPDRIKFINGGLKIFSRSDSELVDCDFRLVQDGMHVLEPYLGSRRVNVSAADLGVLMSQENPFLHKLSQVFQDEIKNITPGGMHYLYTPDGSGEGPQCRLPLAGWKGKASCRVFLPRWERFHYMRLLNMEIKIKDTENKSKDSTKEKEKTEEKAGVSPELDDVKEEKMEECSLPSPDGSTEDKVDEDVIKNEDSPEAGDAEPSSSTDGKNIDTIQDT